MQAQPTWTRSAPAFGGYYEHATVDDHRLTIRHTPNGRWTVTVDGTKLRGSHRDAETARKAALMALAACPAVNQAGAQHVYPAPVMTGEDA